MWMITLEDVGVIYAQRLLDKNNKSRLSYSNTQFGETILVRAAVSAHS